MPETEITRAKARLWVEEAKTITTGFVEVEDVFDGTVSLAFTDEDVEEVTRVWLEPAKARKISMALADVANAIEGRDDE